MVAGQNPAINGEVRYQWKLVRDFRAGEKRVKDCGDAYLPRKSGSCDADYEAYKARGKVGDYTNQALETFHGQIMRKRPVVDIGESPVLRKIMENFNHEGDTFWQFASDVLEDNLQTFFGGIMVDMPVASSGVVSEYDAERENLTPYARYYPAETVADWHYSNMHGVRVLDRVALRETVEDSAADPSSHAVVTQYRILSLDSEGFYKVTVVRELPVMEPDGSRRRNKDGIPEVERTTVFEAHPIVRGKPIGYIPFVFMVCKTPEPSILYGLAELHKHYYMQSCDYENAVHMTTVPTGYVTGHVQEKDDKGAPVPIYLGKDIFLVFPEPEAKVGVLQFSGEGIEHSEEAIAQTLEQIGILGTRALSPDRAMSETSDAAKIHRTGENCKLANYARNAGETFSRVLRIIAEWVGEDVKPSVQFNTDYDSIAFDPNALNAIANLAREGKYPLPLVFEALKKGEYLPPDMDFREFAMLVSLEASGADIMEVVDAYQKLRNGEKVDVTDRRPVAELNAERASNDKLPDQTRGVSMQNGR